MRAALVGAVVLCVAGVAMAQNLISGGSSGAGGASCTPTSGFPGSCTASSYVGTTPNYYLQTVDAGILLADGGGLGDTRIAAFNCPGVVNGVPCLANPYGIVEIYGSLPPGQTATTLCSVELYNAVAGGSAAGCLVGVGNGFNSTKWWRVMAGGSTYQNGGLYFEGGGRLIRQTQSSQYVEFSGNAATNGVAMYVGNQVGMTSAGQLLQFLGTGSANVAAVYYDGSLTSASARTKGVLTLSGGTATATVVAGSVCVCGKVTNEANGVRCSVSSTTLTATGTGTDQVSYLCL